MTSIVRCDTGKSSFKPKNISINTNKINFPKFSPKKSPTEKLIKIPNSYGKTSNNFNNSIKNKEILNYNQNELQKIKRIDFSPKLKKGSHKILKAIP